MLQNVDVGRRRLDAYRRCAGDAVVDELHRLAAPLDGVRVLHVNATSYGGGVAEILRSEVPLLRDLGVVADWKTITAEQGFFEVTKALHNGLQGDPRGLTDEQWQVYDAASEQVAAQLEESYDIVIVHDPQPLALPHRHGRGGAKWVWRCHIDSSQPNPHVWDRLRPLLSVYDAAVFTLGAFVPPGIPVNRVEIIPPAIDPLSPKNMPIDEAFAAGVLDWIGVDTARPLLVQVSRFDPWKDPLGVIDAYRTVKRQVPGVQLALVGSMALDDPEGWRVYRQITSAAADDPDISLFTNLTGVGNIEVNAFQRHADVVIQKSLREGFGLVVSEATWKGTPVVAGRAGGIPLQLPDGVGGLLVDTPDECADAVLGLLADPGKARRFAAAGRELVRERFLLPRLIGDELRLITSLLGHTLAAPRALAAAGTAGEARDPVCGMRVDGAGVHRTEYRGQEFRFCSASCARQFAADPDLFWRAVARAARGASATA
ncbi:glycosyltransferase [Streptomyces prasinosporus]|uniref:Glycosyltransferase n=2 Tax=Streptomyces TaxID=1883 RepID=A0ABP6U067_9ACTN|nr:glycosyltransferase [Streptomyces tricolor]MCG0062739.1 glycosyltransferase [Streptomyces tricolor]GHC13812.1 trehalose synthase [Streptomyces albogriseolus]